VNVTLCFPYPYFSYVNGITVFVIVFVEFTVTVFAVFRSIFSLPEVGGWFGYYRSIAVDGVVGWIYWEMALVCNGCSFL
jgi:hypothetical protein